MNQTDAILAHLKRAPITPLEALRKYRCFRLGARIYTLRSAGYQIKSRLVARDGKRFAQYSLAR